MSLLGVTTALAEYDTKMKKSSDVSLDSLYWIEPLETLEQSPCLNTNEHVRDESNPAKNWFVSNNDRIARGPRKKFPEMLHTILEETETNGISRVLSWQPHGRAFRIHLKKEFVLDVMPRLCKQKKWSSFQRQLNLYGFSRVTKGLDKGAYYHRYFLKGKPSFCHSIERQRVKGTSRRRKSNPDLQPDFYAVPPIGVPSHVTVQEPVKKILPIPKFDKYESQEEFSLSNSSESDENPFENSTYTDNSCNPDSDLLACSKIWNQDINTLPQALIESPVNTIFQESNLRFPWVEISDEAIDLSDDPDELHRIFALTGRPLDMDQLSKLPELMDSILDS